MRLIDVDNVIFEFNRMLDIADERNARPDQKEEFKTIRTYIEWARYVVECAPIVDAVEVVRCKDCKFSPFWFGGNNWKLCPLVDDFVKEQTRDDYCSYGRRREE